jgi:hypothetical protein
MCVRFTVLSDTPIAAAIAGWAVPLSRKQHHLDALALRRWYLPAKRSFQPPHLGFAAFDHLLPPNQMAQANHTSSDENSPDYRPKIPDSTRYGSGIRQFQLSSSQQVTERANGDQFEAHHMCFTQRQLFEHFVSDGRIDDEIPRGNRPFRDGHHIHWKRHPVKSRSQRANLSKINATVRAFDMS